MPPTPLRNASGVPFLILRGQVVVRKGQQPDGDTLAFASGNPYAGDIIPPTAVPVNDDGNKTVNIRLQSIDAPEKEQPRGTDSRDHLLTAAGFNPAAIGFSDTFKAETTSDPVPMWLATHGMDGNRRPLGYLFTADPGFAHGQVVPADDLLSVLKQSLNFKQVSGGAAFPAFYSNTDERHAEVFRVATEAARRRTPTGRRWSVWAEDATAGGFVPTPDELTAGGALIYPKFYRRVKMWANAQPSATAFINWLKRQPDGKKPVEGAGMNPRPLWELFEVVAADRVAVPYDVSRLWFDE